MTSDPREPDVSAPESAESGPKRQAQREREDCLFCKIIAGEIPAEIVADNEHTIAFRDINPQASTHVLVVPRIHHPNIGSLTAAAPDVAATLLSDATAVAAAEGADGNFRLIFNTGADAGQTVFHCHVHVLAGTLFGNPTG